MKIAKAKALDHGDGLLPRRWGVNERHGACRCESSSRSSSNWIQTCFWVWERMVQLWFAVALTGIIAYHTVGALQKKAQGSRTCFRRWSGGVKGFPHAVCQGMQMMQSGYTVKRYSELPKTITLTRRSHFSIEVLPIAQMVLRLDTY